MRHRPRPAEPRTAHDAAGDHGSPLWPRLAGRLHRGQWSPRSGSSTARPDAPLPE